MLKSRLQYRWGLRWGGGMRWMEGGESNAVGRKWKDENINVEILNGHMQFEKAISHLWIKQTNNWNF